jgi:F-type H+-transporting ATPase subunit b
MQINLTPDPSLLAIMVIFILNYMIVRRFFLKPINEVLVSREQETRSADELYAEAMARFQEATTSMETQLHEAKRNAAGVRDGFRAEAAAHRTVVVDQTKAQAEQIVGQATSKLSQDVAEARERIVRESEMLARVAAERILGRAV